MLLYHSTDNKFDKFSIELAGTGWRNSWPHNAFGLWFYYARLLAMNHRRNYVIEAHVVPTKIYLMSIEELDHRGKTYEFEDFKMAPDKWKQYRNELLARNFDLVRLVQADGTTSFIQIVLNTDIIKEFRYV